MRTQRFSKQATREAQEVADAVKQLTSELNTVPFFKDGAMREMLAVSCPAAGDVVLTHGAGRVLRHWLVTSASGAPAALIFKSATREALTLTSSAASTVDLVLW